MLGVAAGMALLMFRLPPIPQPAWYHQFADQRRWLGIPNFANVISNVAFALVGICGIVFILDGVLMGAGDGPYLAGAMVVTLAVFAPVALLVPGLGGGLTALWAAMTLMMTVRMITLGLRTRSGRWIVTGATR